MNVSVITYILRFLGYVLLQGLLLSNINFFGYINPYFYVYFILLLPSSVNRTSSVFLGFLLGLSVDIFSGTLGCHAFATTLVAYIKPYFYRAFGPREDYVVMTPSFKYFGAQMFMQYAAASVFVHHLVFFFVEASSFSQFHITFWKALCCSLFTLLLIYLVEMMKSSKKSNTNI